MSWFIVIGSCIAASSGPCISWRAVWVKVIHQHERFRVPVPRSQRYYRHTKRRHPKIHFVTGTSRLTCMTVARLAVHESGPRLNVCPTCDLKQERRVHIPGKQRQKCFFKSIANLQSNAQSVTKSTTLWFHRLRISCETREAILQQVIRRNNRLQNKR